MDTIQCSHLTHPSRATSLGTPLCLQDAKLLEIVNGKLHREPLVNGVDNQPYAVIHVGLGDVVDEAQVERGPPCKVTKCNAQLDLREHQLPPLRILCLFLIADLQVGDEKVE